jgi:ABC-type polysaccharide/polyol phosphate transport system ATPase subunit
MRVPDIPPGHVEIDNVHVRFMLHKEKVQTLKEAAIKLFRHVREAEEFWALKDVKATVRPGEAVALIGVNGSGKSTLLKTVAGVLTPTYGMVATCGRVSPMIELGVGFDAELTGRENIFLNGAMLGFSRDEMKEKYGRIVEFSELGGFIDVPVKNYSSGMAARLGFSIAVDLEPDILIIDEVLAVGDMRFREKCEARIREFKDQGVTLFFVSHATELVEDLCERAILLDHGKILCDAEVPEAVAQYRELLGMV